MECFSWKLELYEMLSRGKIEIENFGGNLTQKIWGNVILNYKYHVKLYLHFQIFSSFEASGSAIAA